MDFDNGRTEGRTAVPEEKSYKIVFMYVKRF